ncbi:MAG: carbon-nitrogen hydrolase family protein [Gemmataceae bacterium]
MTKKWLTMVVLAIPLWLGSLEAQDVTPTDAFAGWQAQAPRPELRPMFAVARTGAPDGGPALVVRHDAREGLDGCWTRNFPVNGGQWYAFRVLYRAQNVEVERRSVVVKIHWRDDQGRPVPLDEPAVAGYLVGHTPMAETEFPPTGPATASGWREVSGVYRAPSRAHQAIVALHLQWAPHGSVFWSLPSWQPTDPPLPRKARLAAVHFMPRNGKTPMDNCRMFVPWIEKAAQQKADLVVLGEVLTYVGLGKSLCECAEPVPGPATEFFGKLAAKHDLYIVAGLLERDGHLVYNVAVLLGPDGRLVGKYRKVCLPRSEIEAGLAPGKDYPVFDTRFGKVGMMVCYDGFFPEVARELSQRGAEVIAWPVWGCNPLLARARACENHVYIVSSTYSPPEANWMFTGVVDHAGEIVARASQPGEVALVEVDLNQRFRWVSLGDFKAYIPRHRPIQLPEPK